jgi:hypothetical protein
MRRIFLMLALLSAAAVARSATLTPQSKNTARLAPADYTEIQQLYARYNTAIDSGDGAAWAATFVPDGVFNTNTVGHDALVQFVRDWRQNRNGANLRHWNTNIVITATKEGAKGTAYLALMNISGRPAVVQSTGMYEDYLVKTADGWRFKSRTVRLDPVAARPE